MAAINTTKGIAPGKIVYHVYGSIIAKGQYNKDKDIEDHVEKLIVTSFPKYWHHSTQRRCDSLFFDVIRQSTIGDGDWRTGHSVRDCGIECPHGKYNLNRIFATKEEAMEFVSECMMGKFFDKEDQDVYNRQHKGEQHDYYYHYTF